MIQDVVVKKLQRFEDSRGWLAEIWRKDADAYRPLMAYVSQTEPGIVRGPHEHKKQSDCFVFIGPGEFELHLWDRRAGSETEKEHQIIYAGAGEPAMVIVPPGVVHGYKCVSGVPGWCINLPDKLYKGEGKTEEVDEIRWEDDVDSPYVI